MPWYEFPEAERVWNPRVCHGCFNVTDTSFLMTPCPRFGEQSPQYMECQRKIPPQMVLRAVGRIRAALGVLTRFTPGKKWQSHEFSFYAPEDVEKAEIQFTRFGKGIYEIDDLSFKTGCSFARAGQFNVAFADSQHGPRLRCAVGIGGGGGRVVQGLAEFKLRDA